ncbi:hypothetical protein EV193_101390 [Herbihabitans rhizosphaerae]|uniref:DUF3592 domain-containing protein n=1 Tax=Herbihabitans rhizosphaerae TaxID=1872711 RepID=A0A4Q7L5G5_9PSEU|nr:hypothetical protein EV193_101390 [Herbihabitans rhizosphaerae]
MLLAVGVLVTLCCVLVAFGAWQNDRAITAHTGHANAEVVSASFGRALVRFDTPDGAVQAPPLGVLYPQGLETGQVVAVEYDERDPELVRVAGRNVSLALLPLAGVAAVTWLIVAPLLWWSHRSGVRIRRKAVV